MQIRKIAKRVANRYLQAKDECSGIKDIHKYVKCRAEKLKEDGAEEGKAFGTAWGIACKHKRDVLDPKNEVCTMPPSGYLKKKKANSDVTFSMGRLFRKHFTLRFLNIYSDRSNQRAFITLRIFFKSKFGGETYEEFAVEVHKGRKGRMEFLDSYELHLVKFYKNSLELNKVLTLTEWVKNGRKTINSINYLIKRNHKKIWHGFHNKDRLRVLPSQYGSINDTYIPLANLGVDDDQPQEPKSRISTFDLDLDFGSEYDVGYEIINLTIKFSIDYGDSETVVSLNWKGFTKTDIWDLEDGEEFISKDEVLDNFYNGKAWDFGSNSLYRELEEKIPPSLWLSHKQELTDLIVEKIYKVKNSNAWEKEIDLFWDYVNRMGLDV